MTVKNSCVTLGRFSMHSVNLSKLVYTFYLNCHCFGESKGLICYGCNCTEVFVPGVG